MVGISAWVPGLLTTGFNCNYLQASWNLTNSTKRSDNWVISIYRYGASSKYPAPPSSSVMSRTGLKEAR